MVDFFHSYISELGADPFRHPPNSSAPSLLSEAKPFAPSPSSINIFIVAQGTEMPSQMTEIFILTPLFLLIVSVLS